MLRGARSSSGGGTPNAISSNSSPPSKLPSGGGGGTVAEDGGLTIDEVEELVGLGRFQAGLLFVAGLGFAADCMEVTLMAFMAPGVSEDWAGRPPETVLSHLGLAVFGGELLGCLAWGPFADTHGRQRAYLLSCLLMLLASIASAVSPTYAFLLCTRALVGVGIGGLAVPFDLLCEATPPRQRGAMLMAMQTFWVLGSVAVVGLAWGVLPAFPPAIAWRWLAGLAAVPLLVATVATCFLPESPRWLLEQGQVREAWEGLCRAAAWNGKDLTAAVLGLEGARRREEEKQGGVAVVAAEAEGNKQKDAAAAAAAAASPHLLLFHPHHHKQQHQQQEGPGKAAAASGGAGPSVGQQSHGCSALASTFLHLLSPSLRTTTLFLWVIWFSFGLAYYGIVLYAAHLFSSPSSAGSSSGGDGGDGGFDFPPLLWSAAAEGAGVLLALGLLERCGRKGTQAITYLVAAVGAGVLGLAAGVTRTGSVGRQRVVTGGAAVARIGAMAASSTTWVATPEAYPTAVRSTGHSVASAVARIGAILAPQVVAVGKGRGDWAPAAVLAGASLVAGVFALLLPKETGFGAGLDAADEVEAEAEMLAPAVNRPDGLEEGQEASGMAGVNA